eukprot:1078173-Prymnesium_polylepis.1
MQRGIVTPRRRGHPTNVIHMKSAHPNPAPAGRPRPLHNPLPMRACGELRNSAQLQVPRHTKLATPLALVTSVPRRPRHAHGAALRPIICRATHTGTVGADPALAKSPRTAARRHLRARLRRQTFTAARHPAATPRTLWQSAPSGAYTTQSRRLPTAAREAAR